MSELIAIFLAEARALLDTAANSLLRLEVNPSSRPDMDALFRAVHTIKGSSGMVQGVEPLTRLVHAGEDLLEQMRAGEIQFDVTLADHLFKLLDLLTEWLDALEGGGLPETAEADSIRHAATLRASLVLGQHADSVDLRSPEAFRQMPSGVSLSGATDLDASTLTDLATKASIGPLSLLTYRPLQRCFFGGEDPFDLVRKTPDLIFLKATLGDIPPDVPSDPYQCYIEFTLLSTASEEALIEHFLYVLNEVQRLDLTREAREPVPSIEVPTDTARPAPNRPRELRVDQARVDKLMNLSGELIVAKNALAFFARRIETEFGQRDIGRELRHHYQALTRLADDMQQTVMRIRMIPVSQVFSRFPRLVRDLARRLEKDVELVIEGENTEADKNVIEDLADPLVHLVRNSLDHGLETPAIREAAGKVRKGTLRLSAAQVGERIIIEVSDDGCGIDPARIRRLGVERGLITEAEAASMSDDASFRLILLPGFSTAQAVTELSGRGVGMDVVRNVIEGSGGGLTIRSVLGQGTTISLSLPLAMTVSKVMVFRLGDQSYGMPMEDLRAIVRLPKERIRSVADRRMAVLQEELMPIIDLGALLGIKKLAAGTEASLPVLVVQAGGKPCGLVVDDFEQSHDIVLKPFEGLLSGSPSFSGSAMLGDGRILLVMRTPEIVECL